MKFAVEVSNAKQIERVLGFSKLEDACVCALAMAARRKGTEHFVAVRPSRRSLGSFNMLTGICCNSIENFPLHHVLNDAQRNLSKLKAEIRKTNERSQFLKENGGFDGELAKWLFGGQGQVDELLRQQYFANDFSAVTTRIRELREREREVVTA